MIIFVFALACSWENSVYVRDFIENSLTPFLKSHKEKLHGLPEHCPFHSALKNDMLAPYYSLKYRQNPTSFLCTACQKEFRKEESLESHIVKHHVSAPGICLGDFCQFLQCKKADEVIQNRCESVMTQCFSEDLLAESLKLCEFKEESMWDIELQRPLYFVLIIFSAIVCLVYYLVLWAEAEQDYHVKTVKKTNKKKYKRY